MPESIPAAEKERVAFAAVVLLLRQMAHQLLTEGRADEARGLIDGLDAIRARTKGNVTGEEKKFLDDVVYDLQMMAVRGPSAGPAESASGDDDEAGRQEGPPAEPPPGGEASG
jgi:hypothetical protein